MRDATIAKNYAEALLSLAGKANDLAGWGQLITDVSTAIESDAMLRRFLESPKVSAEEKNAILGKALQDKAPRLFVRFLQQLVKNRRQMLIPEIAQEYSALLDEKMNRLHAQVTVAQAPSDAERSLIAKELSRAMGKEVLPHVTVNPELLGGVVVRVGDTVMDGSVRRRLTRLRNILMTGTT